MDLMALIVEYERYLKGESRRPKGVKRYVWGMSRFVQWLSETGYDPVMENINHQTVQEYKTDLGVTGKRPATIINALSIIKDFCKFSIDRGYRFDDATVNVRRPKKSRPNPKPLYEDEVRLIMNAIKTPPDLTEWQAWHWLRNRRAVGLFLYTGARLSEITELRWRNIHLPRHIIEIRGGKNDKDRNVPIPKPLIEVLDLVPRDGRKPALPVIGKRDGDEIRPMTDKGLAKIITHWLKRQLENAHIDIHVHPHIWRHTYASLLVWQGTDLKTVQELLGHEDLGTTEWYVHVRDDDKQRAAARLPDLGL